jgi:hypothetical protein
MTKTFYAIKSTTSGEVGNVYVSSYSKRGFDIGRPPKLWLTNRGAEKARHDILSILPTVRETSLTVVEIKVDGVVDTRYAV